MLKALAETVRAKLRSHRRPEIETFIQRYPFPPGLRTKVATRLPGLSEREIDEVLLGLKDFLKLHLDAEGFILGMPSKAIDVAWHEFILYTRDYTAFCERAFGYYLHHVPDDPRAATYDPARGLGRTWIWYCIQADEDPRYPVRVPRLFAIDAEIGLADARVYTLDDLAALPIPPSFIETEPGRYRYIGGRPKRPAYWIGASGDGWFNPFADSGGNSGGINIHHGGGHHGGGHHGGGHHGGHSGCGGGDGGGHGCGGGGGCGGGQ